MVGVGLLERSSGVCMLRSEVERSGGTGVDEFWISGRQVWRGLLVVREAFCGVVCIW